MSNYLFKGPFAEHIENHVSLKKAIGYKYEAEASHLLRFSSFTEQKSRSNNAYKGNSVRLVLKKVWFIHVAFVPQKQDS